MQLKDADGFCPLSWVSSFISFGFFGCTILVADGNLHCWSLLVWSWISLNLDQSQGWSEKEKLPVTILLLRPKLKVASPCRPSSKLPTIMYVCSAQTKAHIESY